MNKKVKAPANKKLKNKNDLDLPENIILDDDEDEVDAAEIEDESVDEEVLKVLKPAKPKTHAPKPVVDKHDYIAELERDSDDFDE